MKDVWNGIKMAKGVIIKPSSRATYSTDWLEGFAKRICPTILDEEVNLINRNPHNPFLDKEISLDEIVNSLHSTAY